jgi:hypothetical protein
MAVFHDQHRIARRCPNVAEHQLANGLFARVYRPASWETW